MLLIVILVMVVSLTIGLSIAQRTITNIKISKESEESQRAFQAAEAGLEVIRKVVEKKREGKTISQEKTDLSNNSSFTTESEAQIVPVAGVSQGVLNNDQDIDQDKGIDVWLMDYDKFTSSTVTAGDFDGNIEFRWWTGQTGTCGSGKDSVPALEVMLLSGTKANPTVTKYFFDWSGCSRSNAATSVASIPGPYKLTTGTIAILDGIVAKVIPIYNSSKIFVRASGTPPLAVQGYKLTSTGSSGETVRKIELFESNPNIPTEMFYAILSQ